MLKKIVKCHASHCKKQAIRFFAKWGKTKIGYCKKHESVGLNLVSYERHRENVSNGLRIATGNYRSWFNDEYFS